jgi:hypothetical protein
MEAEDSGRELIERALARPVSDAARATWGFTNRAGHVGRAGFGGIEGQSTTSSSAVTLGEIERVGWRLEHVGYYFMLTGETSTDRVFGTGQATAVSGVTVGVYLFRNTALPEPVS